MFCCCPKNQSSSSYAVENDQNARELEKNNGTKQADQKPVGAPTQANIHTGKGPLSASNQSLPSEASLDKSTIEATRKEKAPVTAQPVNATVQAATQRATTDAAKQAISPQPPIQEVVVAKAQQSANETAPPKVVSTSAPGAEGSVDNNKAVDISQVEAQIVTPGTVNESQSPAPPQNANFVSTIKVTSPQPPPPSANTLPTQAANLAGGALPNNPAAPILNELDSLETSVTEAESLPPAERKKASADLASRLQAVSSKVISVATTSPQIMSDQLQGVVARLEAVTSRLESLASKSKSSGDAQDDDPPFLDDYTKLHEDVLLAFIKSSNALGGDVATQAALVQKAFDAAKDLMIIAARNGRPSQADLPKVLAPLSQAISEVQEFADKNRRSKMFNHLKAVSEGIPFLGWVTVPKTAQYVMQMTESANFYTNRVLKDFKESDPKQADWAKEWLKLMKGPVHDYVKDYHASGLEWNGNRPPATGSTTAGSKSAGGPPPPPGPPAPPPPGPPPPPAMAPPSGGDDGGDRNALFSEINKGAGVTKGLKKVTDDMKTHKNPQLRQGPAPFKPTAAPKPVATPKPAPAAAVVKPPVFELEGKKWLVEYQKNNKNLVIDQTQLHHSVYAYKCEGSVIQVKGKINSIILDSCKKTAIVFDDLVSSLEFVNCQSMQAQVIGVLPTVSIDKTDGCQIYLSEKSLNASIVSAKSSEMNVSVPTASGDMKEFALPEQYKTVYDGKTMVTTVTESM